MESGVEPLLEGPVFSWGDPCGTYSVEIVTGGAVLFYRATQKNGGMLEIKIPFTVEALAEMQGLMNMLVFDKKVEGIPNGQIRATA